MRTQPISTALILLASPIPLSGQTMSAEKRQAFAEQVALADGYRQLTIKVSALPLGSSRTVADLAAASASSAIGIRQLVAQAERVGRPRRYSNGDVEVDLKLPLAPFVEGLRRLLTAAPPTSSIKAANPDAVKTRSGLDELRVTGFGRPPTEDELTGPPGWPDGRKAGDLPPPGWANVTASGFKAAQRAAELDAIDHLARQIAELKMGSGRTVGELIAQAPAIDKGLRRRFDALRFTKTDYLPEQICRLRVDVDVQDVAERLEQLWRSLDRKPDVTQDEIKSIVRFAKTRRLRAVGYGLPPSSSLRKNPYAVVDVDEPAWAARTLSARGEGILPEFEQATDRTIEIATQDARLSAQLELAREIDRLALPGGTTVAAFLERHEDLAEDILTLLGSARPADSPAVDKARRRVSLTLELPLRRLWLILRDAIPTVETTTLKTP